MAADDADTTYEALFEANRARIERLCRLLLPDPSHAEEVCQDVFLKLHTALTTDPRTIRWEPWLARVAVNACKDVRRASWWKAWSHRASSFDDELHASAAASPERQVLGRETRLRIHRSFSALSGRQREVFALRHFEGYSTDEVADLLGLSPGSVKRHLHRAVHHLRAALGEER